MKTSNKFKKKEYSLIRLGEEQLLNLYGSFDGNEKEFRKYLKDNEDGFKKGLIEYYALREDSKYIAQVTIIYENKNIDNATIKDKRIYLKNFNILKNRSNMGFEPLFLELVIDKLNAKKIKEYTISINFRARNLKNILEELRFIELDRFFNTETNQKEILYLRKDKLK